MKRLRIRVCGIVQGVFFRVSTQRKARELGLAGCVRNEPPVVTKLILPVKRAERLTGTSTVCARASPPANASSRISRPMCKSLLKLALAVDRLGRAVEHVDGARHAVDRPVRVDGR